LNGLKGAGTGYWTRTFCVHAWHRVTLTLVLIAIETVVTVQLVG
jgi:hypothetical protein